LFKIIYDRGAVMGSACCGNKEEQLSKIPLAQIKVLWVVLLINLAMFFIELSSGLVADSLALMSDSFDMLGDTLAYAATLYVINLGSIAKARSAMLKAWIMLLSAMTLIGASAYRIFFIRIPASEMMSAVGMLALTANLLCLLLLSKYRKSDINMESVWICSRNDIIANISIIAAAGLVHITATPWPDLIVGIALAVLFAHSAFHIYVQAKHEMQL
jgi:Co/Zn/Cd efflux system component